MPLLKRFKRAAIRAASLAVAACALSGWSAPPAGEVDPPVGANPLFPSHAEHALPSAEVIIDAGHGGIDGGTHVGDILEKDINLAISRKLYLILRSHGVRAVLNRTGDYALSDDNRWHRSSRHQRDLSQRGGLPDELDAGIFVSIHVNWSKRSGTRGPIVIHQEEAHSALLGTFIQQGLNRQQQSKFLPQSGGKFYVLKKIKIPSVIVETAFMSNAKDREMLTSPRGQTRIAAAIAGGILAYRCVSP
ncbi:N-acetylmuramoyl-L-alanine amidase [Cohnella nanjingensis]|uniref:N-acetylmuramoyl-L-alanine amidase n=1 Tax=Cohnella nanjingensis TaxID=1387779 RepID=A0A7X0RWI7_9BACL|nr:N-acetylmuramoyl-L-alanine amidase [Cohnella nanjingensis]